MKLRQLPQKNFETEGRQRSVSQKVELNREVTRRVRQLGARNFVLILQRAFANGEQRADSSTRKLLVIREKGK